MLADFLIASSAEVSLLRWVAIFALLVAVHSVVRHELAGVVREKKGWVVREAALCRTRSGYVGAVLGRYSLLLAASSLGFAVFRPEYFAGEGARQLALFFSFLSILLGILAGYAMLKVTREIIRQTREAD